MYKKIVVGADGSDRSEIAVKHAIAIAKFSGATLHVVHARPATNAKPGANFASAVVTETSSAYDKGDEICARAIAEAQTHGVPGEMHSISGDPADVIVKVAEAEGADLIVVGNHGMHGARRFVLGSVPNTVSHHCPCSLLIVDTGQPL